MLIWLALMTETMPAVADQRLSDMTRLYEQVCLKTFPDDKAVDALMSARQARPLSPEEVKVTMVDDPARGWSLADGSGTVWIEFPPYHACSVRWNAPRIGDLSEYREIARRYENALGGFRPIADENADRGDIHVHIVGEEKISPDHRVERLYFIDQRLNDPKRLAAGETGVVLRFVHQFAPEEPGAK